MELCDSLQTASDLPIVSFRARDRLEVATFGLCCTQPALVRVLSTGWLVIIPFTVYNSV